MLPHKNVTQLTASPIKPANIHVCFPSHPGWNKRNRKWQSNSRLSSAKETFPSVNWIDAAYLRSSPNKTQLSAMEIENSILACFLLIRRDGLKRDCRINFVAFINLFRFQAGWILTDISNECWKASKNRAFAFMIDKRWLLRKGLKQCRISLVEGLFVSSGDWFSVWEVKLTVPIAYMTKLT